MSVWNDSLPEDWLIERLGALSQVKGGKRLPKGEKLVPGPTLFPYIRVCDFKDFSVELGDIHYLTPDIQEKISRYTISTDDVFISIAGTIGRVGRIPEQLNGANLTENAARIVLNDDGRLSQDFLKYCLASPQLQGDIASRRSKNAQPKLALAQIKDLAIPLPPLPEQKKIAHILSTVQRAIEAQERIIQTTTELKKALMHKLFTEGLRNEPQKQTEIGPVPESWEVVPFDQLATLQRGYDLRKQDFREGEVPVIGATQVIGYHDTANVKAPGVTVVRSGSSAGRPLFISEDFWAHNVLLFVKDFHGNIPKFVYHKILALDLTQYRQGVAVPTLNRNTFSSIELSLPCLEEQQEIVDALDSVGNRMEVAERKKTQLQDLFRTLLHELMTAKTRVYDFQFQTSPSKK